MSPSDAADLPAILASVKLRLEVPDGASVELPTRVGDVEDTDGIRRVVVAPPDLSGLSEPETYPHEGEELTLLWAHPSCQMQMRVAAVATTRHYGPVWLLTPTAAPTREQRREFFRIPLSLPAELRPVPTRVGPRAVATPATLVDIGEGGAQIHCEAGLPEVGSLVELSFTLDGQTFTTQAEVLRHLESTTGQPSAACRFLDPTAYGDQIRQAVFAMQRIRSRTGLG